ncbi:MAG: hypothetical protein GY822_06025 [Deltaproteobacteria bacterium]|nr:hypothetical protein [Deltaproteobacteria bacterium]
MPTDAHAIAIGLDRTSVPMEEERNGTERICPADDENEEWKEAIYAHEAGAGCGQLPHGVRVHGERSRRRRMCADDKKSISQLRMMGRRAFSTGRCWTCATCVKNAPANCRLSSCKMAHLSCGTRLHKSSTSRQKRLWAFRARK